MLKVIIRSAAAGFTACLAAGCSTPSPFQVERVGTLPPSRYEQFERATAVLPPVKYMAGPGQFPEPNWVYAFDAAFDPHTAPLQIGSFTGRGAIAERVASHLPAQLLRVLGEANLFPAVTLQTVNHAFILSGVVTRADDEGFDDGAATQVEASLTRDGVVLGAIQINAAQIGVSPLAPVLSAVLSAGQGTRSAFVARRFADVFQSLAAGSLSRASSGGLIRRHMLTSNGRPKES